MSDPLRNRLSVSTELYEEQVDALQAIDFSVGVGVPADGLGVEHFATAKEWLFSKLRLYMATVLVHVTNLEDVCGRFDVADSALFSHGYHWTSARNATPQILCGDRSSQNVRYSS